MKNTYAVLGAGMQGTSAAYDLAQFSEAQTIFMGDASLEQASRSADRVNGLVRRQVCKPAQVDALDPESLLPFLEPAEVVLSCVPYWMHPKVAPIAIAAKTSMLDMGGDTRVSMRTLALDDEAKQNGVTIVPDTGLAPGLVNNLAAYILESFDQTDEVHLYCGGLPQHPKPPFNYKLVFNIEGLTTEYMDQATVVRNGKIQMVDTLEELEELEVDRLGKMEAFTTSGGTSTAPHTFVDKVKVYEYKTIRYPGHCERMKIFKDFGFWGRDAIPTRSGVVKPLDMFHALMSERLKDPEDRDLVVVRAVGLGNKKGKPARLQMDILEFHDPKTKFTAMERLTGSSTAIYAAEIASGHMPKGCLRYETAMPGAKFVAELRRRGVEIKETESAGNRDSATA